MTRTRRTALAVLSVAALSLTGCGANLDAATTRPYQPAEGTNVDTGDIAVRSVLVIGDGQGNASVVATFVNGSTTPDQLVQASVGGAPATISGGSLAIPATGSASIGRDVRAEASGLSGQVTPGLLTDVEFVFGTAPRTSLRAIVLEPIGPYAAYAPTASTATPSGGEPTPTPTPAETDHSTDEAAH